MSNTIPRPRVGRPSIIVVCLALVLAIVGGSACVVDAATALVRWIPGQSPDVTGYRVYVRDAGKSYTAAAAWSGNPTAGSDGVMSASVSYTPATSGTNYFTVVSTSSTAESGLAEELPIGSTDPCRDDRCVTKTTCTFGPRPDGTPCDDASFCNGAEVCMGGVCQSSSQPRNCADAIACTVDTCDEAAKQCTHVGPPGCCLACDALDPCLADACAQGICNAGPGTDMEVNRVKLLQKSQSTRLIAKFRFTMDPAVDPSVTGATVAIRTADGAVLYSSTIPGRLINVGAAIGRYRYTASKSTLAPLGNGLTRLDFRIKESTWMVTVMASTPVLGDAALESSLTMSLKLDGSSSCARHMDIPCYQKPGLSICR